MRLITHPRTQVAVLERSARRGQMPPLHSRSEGELFQVMEGEVTFFVGDEVVRAQPYDVVVAPAGAARTFRVESAEARWIVSTQVSSPERYADFARAVAEPLGDAAGWPSAEELATVSAIASANDIELLGPPGDLPG